MKQTMPGEDVMSKEEVPLSESMCRLSLRDFMTAVLMVLALWFTASTSAQESKPPRYEVDAAWPKPLPNNWLIGQVGGLAVDKHDHIWVNLAIREVEALAGHIPGEPTDCHQAGSAADGRTSRASLLLLLCPGLCSAARWVF